jgi:tRNA (mo5U34)-methyltransferase
MSAFSYVRLWQRNLDHTGWWHSFELPDGRRIEGASPLTDLRERIGQFPIPEDLRGARVLDIGAWDGWFSFEMERRGADVLAVDNWDNPHFHQIHAALKSRVEYRQLDVYELTPETVGRFDIVLFMGVLYHLKHPLLALERVCALTTGMAAVDSFILRERHRPGENVENRTVMEFYETDEFGGQTDNWCGPSLPCLMAMCRTAGFARVEYRGTLVNSACIACYRGWNLLDPSAPSAPAPELVDVFHHTNFGLNFQSRYDEYVSALFRIPPRASRPERIEPQVGGYGVNPIHVKPYEFGDTWQANFKLPPGLAVGWHDVTLSVEGSLPSNPKRLAVDLPVAPAQLRIDGVSDGTTWEQDVFDPARGNVVTAWVQGLPENADRVNIRALLGGEPVGVIYVSPERGQVNVEVPPEVPRCEMDLELSSGGIRSERRRFQIKA